jgi:hypothetical protein
MDLDLFIKADPANARATHAALSEFGAALQGIRPEQVARTCSTRSAALPTNEFPIMKIHRR